MLRIRYASFLLLLLLFCCRKPYSPTVISSPNSHLVVEGIIDAGDDSTIIRLSNTVKLDTVNSATPITDAGVIVESDDNNSWVLPRLNAGGYYGAPSLKLNTSQKYRLHIVMNDTRQYATDFMPVKPTPPIDSIGYYFKNNKT